MTARATLTLATLLIATLAGCGGGGGGGSRGQAAAPVASGSTSATATATTGATTSGATTGALPPGAPGEFTRTFRGRSYQVVVPARYRAAVAAPLLLALHGAGDDVANFTATLRAGGWLAAAEAQGVIVVVPATKSPTGSFPNWSGNPNNDLPAMGVEMDDLVALVRADVSAQWAVDGRQVHALGFSDGGLFLGATGLQRAELATCTIFGYGWGAFDITPVTTRRPVHLACGSGDQFFRAAEQTQAFLAARGHDLRWDPVANVGHTFLGLSRAILPSDSLAWCLARPLPSAPGAPTGPGATPATPPTTPIARGIVTRQITTAAQAGLPSITLRFDVYVPARYDPAVAAAPLVFAVNMGLDPWRAIADAEGLLVVDLRDHDRNGGFNFDYDVLQLDGALRDVQAAYRVDPKRVHLHGFSAGAHWGYAVVLANANLFAGLGISAGSLTTAIQQGVFPGGVQRRLPVAIRHGTTDAVVPVQAGRDDRARLTSAGHPVELTEFAGGHTISAADAQAIWTFLRAQRAP